MMSCPSCGKENSPHRDRCVHCGARLQDRPKTTPIIVPDQEDEHTELAGVLEEDEHTELAGVIEEDEHTSPEGSLEADEHTQLLPDDDSGDATMHLDPESIEAGKSVAAAPIPQMAADDGSPLQVGQAFGSRYRIEKLLGFGGMGAVYKAHDQELDIPVALKIIRPEVAADPALAEKLDRRFKRELLLARKVTHKNVVRIHDLGEIEGVKYITMTYIEGEDLSEILKREGTVSVPDALKIMRPVLSATKSK
jgi:hypothetical protein